MEYNHYPWIMASRETPFSCMEELVLVLRSRPVHNI